MRSRFTTSRSRSRNTRPCEVVSLNWPSKVYQPWSADSNHNKSSMSINWRWFARLIEWWTSINRAVRLQTTLRKQCQSFNQFKICTFKLFTAILSSLYRRCHHERGRWIKMIISTLQLNSIRGSDVRHLPLQSSEHPWYQSMTWVWTITTISMLGGPGTNLSLLDMTTLDN